MKLIRTTRNSWKGKRKDGTLVSVKGFYNIRQIWEVNHGPVSSRKKNYFEKKHEAIRFVESVAEAPREWEDIYVVGYPRHRAIRGQRGELLGIVNS